MGRSQDRAVANLGALASRATVGAAEGIQAAAAEGMQSYNRSLEQGARPIAEIHLFFFSLGVMIMVAPLKFLTGTDLFRSTGIWELLGICAASLMVFAIWIAIADIFLEHGFVGEGIVFNAILPLGICNVIAKSSSSMSLLALVGIWLLSRVACETLFESVWLLRKIRMWLMNAVIMLMVLAPIIIMIWQIIVGWKVPRTW